MEACRYNGSRVEVEWKWSGSMYLEWKYLGIRMELEWKWISTVEIGLKEVALTYGGPLRSPIVIISVMVFPSKYFHNKCKINAHAQTCLAVHIYI